MTVPYTCISFFARDVMELIYWKNRPYSDR